MIVQLTPIQAMYVLHLLKYVPDGTPEMAYKAACEGSAWCKANPNFTPSLATVHRTCVAALGRGEVK